MKLRISCGQCRIQELDVSSTEFQPVEITDDGCYRMKCSAGHVSLTILQNQKFEVLFDLGAMALIDGYPREAVTSMAAALERFYEFYITVICLKHGIEKEGFARAWKNVAAQSERQFGAYLFSYLIDHKGGEPPVIDNIKPEIEGRSKGNVMPWKEFRNAVVHKGYIPPVLETLAYGDIVYRHVWDLVMDLKRNSGESIEKAIRLHLSKRYEVNAGLIVSTILIPTMISLAVAEAPVDSLEKALESVKDYRKWVHHL